MNVVIVSIPSEKERNRNMRIRNAFEECLHSNLSTDDITSAQKPRSEKGERF